jgi:hypothetical protein
MTKDKTIRDFLNAENIDAIKDALEMRILKTTQAMETLDSSEFTMHGQLLLTFRWTKERAERALTKLEELTKPPEDKL